MSVGGSTAEAGLAEVAQILGLPDPHAISDLDMDVLRRRTHRQLLEATRRLGLSGVSKLTKDALASRLWEALGRVRAAPVPEPAAPEAPEPAPQDPVLTHKYELGEHAVAPPRESRDIPWSYGEDRVTAMAIDPDRLYCYWELTDDAIARARTALGAGGADAWLNVRVYDTTGRLFDGTNAHTYFDHRIERHERQWFFVIGKPTSEAFVDVGLRSNEGYFVKVVRSGRIEFPRREPAPWADPEWLTVRPFTGEVEPGGRGSPARPAPGAAGGGGPGGGAETAGAGRFEPLPLWELRRLPWDEILRLGGHVEGERIEWEEIQSDSSGEGWRVFEWEGPLTVTSWEAGPFTYPVEVPPPESEAFVGQMQIFRVGERTHLVYGPWQVVIRGLGAQRGRAVIARWEVHRSWVTAEGAELRGLRGGPVAPGSSDLMVGASERRWLGASELRLRGASELYFLGASERRMMGASERLYAGASERILRGASERRLAGQSELRMAGASERLYTGASERLTAGASDRRLGASEHRLGGGEERRDSGDGRFPAALESGPREG